MTARAALIKVQIARKELKLADDDYRSILERLTGHRSAADCSDAELGRVLDEFKTKGWTPKVIAGGKSGRPESRKAGKPADHPAAKKARALWLSLWNLGEIHDPAETALEAFARRQLGVERLQWADQALVYKLIEALKAIGERAGWDQRTTRMSMFEPVVQLKRALMNAQIQRLQSLQGFPEETHPRLPTIEEEIDDRVTDYGRRIRDLGAAG